LGGGALHMVVEELGDPTNHRLAAQNLERCLPRRGRPGLFLRLHAARTSIRNGGNRKRRRFTSTRARGPRTPSPSPSVLGPPRRGGSPRRFPVRCRGG